MLCIFYGLIFPVLKLNVNKQNISIKSIVVTLIVLFVRILVEFYACLLNICDVVQTLLFLNALSCCVCLYINLLSHRRKSRGIRDVHYHCHRRARLPIGHTAKSAYVKALDGDRNRP